MVWSRSRGKKSRMGTMTSRTDTGLSRRTGLGGSRASWTVVRPWLDVQRSISVVLWDWREGMNGEKHSLGESCCEGVDKMEVSRLGASFWNTAHLQLF